NNQQITGRTQLKNDDKIRICDFLATFEETALMPLPAELRPEEEEPDEGGSTTVEATMAHHSSLLLETHPTEKLRALLEISENLRKPRTRHRVFPKFVDRLSRVSKQPARCFITLVEDATGRLLPKVTRPRRVQDETNARFSRSIVKQCLESKALFLSNNA